MHNNQTDFFRTKDLAVASMLVVKGLKLINMEREGKTCWFEFSNKIECEKLSTEYYYNDITIYARAFHEAMSRLKGRIFSMD